MKLMVISVTIGTVGTVDKVLVRRLEELEIEGRTESIETTSLLRSARILEIDLDIRGDLLSLGLQ